MSTPRARLPYLWVTWATGLLAGDKHCLWAAWFKARFKYQAVDDGFRLEAWKAQHDALVAQTVTEYTAAGLAVMVEDQNAFVLRGRTLILAGKPDLVAVRAPGADHPTAPGIVIDCKTGKVRSSDYWQVLLYMFAVPQTREGVSTLAGEVRYPDHAVSVHAAELDTVARGRIVTLLAQVGADPVPPRTPSAAECRFCNIPKSECPARVEPSRETRAYSLEF